MLVPACSAASRHPGSAGSCKENPGRQLLRVPHTTAAGTRDSTRSQPPQCPDRGLAHLSSLTYTWHTEEESEKQGQPPASAPVMTTLKVVGSYSSQLLLPSMKTPTTLISWLPSSAYLQSDPEELKEWPEATQQRPPSQVCQEILHDHLQPGCQETGQRIGLPRGPFWVLVCQHRTPHHHVQPCTLSCPVWLRCRGVQHADMPTGLSQVHPSSLQCLEAWPQVQELVLGTAGGGLGSKHSLQPRLTSNMN